MGWSAYTQDPDRLCAAVAGSAYVVQAHGNGQLVGLARAISDDASIAYLQDILIHPEVQRHGIVRRLLGAFLARYAHVRRKVLLTDARPEQLRFYASLGFKNTREFVQTPLNAFVIIEGAHLA